MYKTSIRKVGGSLMLAIPPVLLEILHLTAGTQVGIDIDGGKLVVTATRVPEYSLDQLLAQCHPEQPLSEDDQTWTGGTAAGNELI
jgi:antitoxin ChpS